MAVEEPAETRGPHLCYAREGALREVAPHSLLAEALELARKVERLLEDAPVGRAEERSHSSHSTRIARAMAASLVDELEVLARPSRETGAA